MGFRERDQYLFELESTTPCTLVIDDVIISGRYEGERYHWKWRPQFFAGTVHAELLNHDGVRIAQYQLDVSPDPSKLGQETFLQLLNELLASSPQLVFGAEAAQTGVGANGSYSNPHLEYGRLKVFGPLLLHSIQRVCSKPVSILRSDRELVASHRVRKFDQHSIRALTRSPQALAALRGIEGASAPPDRLLFDVPRSSRELDTPAHRTLLSLMLAVIRRVRKVRAELEGLTAKESVTSFRTPLASRMQYRGKLLDELEQALRYQCRAEPFASVRRAEISAAGLNVIAGHPLYATAYRRGWQLMRPGINGEQEGEMLPISPTWEIYERWCFLRVTDILVKLFPALTWKRKIKGTDRVVQIGKSAGVTVKVFLQKTFRAMDKVGESEEFYSISGKRRPDIVVTFETENIQRFVVFDPKYSVARSSVLSAMEAAHIYSDCLRWRQRSPDLTLLLIPAAGGASWLENSNFHSAHQVGTLPLSPTTGLEQLRQLLERTLRSPQ